MALQWALVKMLTGEIICNLPGVETSDPMRRTIGQLQSVSATLTVTDTTDPGWINVVENTGGVALIAYTGAPGSEVVAWGGIVVQAPRTSGNTVVMSLSTPEWYLDGRFTGDYSCTGKDQNQIVSDLVSQFAADSGGWPITVQVVGGPGMARDRTYNDFDDKTVLSNLQDLMGLQGGPEWTMHWQWTHGPEKVTPVLYVGTRIGDPVQPGLAPAVTFEASKMVSFTYGSDYSAGKGANIVTATSSGQGAVRPTSGPVRYVDPNRPKYEMRYSPSTSITDNSTLGAYAQQALMNLKAGARPVTLTLPLGQPGYQVGVDWDLGDDVGVILTGTCFPTEVEGYARCIGYEVTAQSVSPILAGDKLIPIKMRG